MNEARLLRRLGREVVVFSWIKDPASPLLDEEIREGLRIRRHKAEPPRGSFGRPVGFRRLAKTFADEIAALEPEAILCHDLEMLWASVLAGRRLQIPVLYHAHEDWPAMVSERSHLEAFVFERLERRLLRHVDHVYAAGEDRADRFRKQGKSVTVVYGAKPWAEIPDVSETERLEVRLRTGFAPDDFVLGIAGSFGRDEALPTILEAMAGLPEAVKLLVVGGAESKIRQGADTVARVGLDSRVRFTGRLPTEAYLRTTAILDVGFALYYPRTRNDTTVVPLKLFDYMALGIPVIVSDFPEMRRIVTEECGCGAAVDPTDSRTVRTAIEDLLRDPKGRRGTGLRGRTCFRERFCWEIQEEALLRSHRIFSSA